MLHRSRNAHLENLARRLHAASSWQVKPLTTIVCLLSFFLCVWGAAALGVCRQGLSNEDPLDTSSVGRSTDPDVNAIKFELDIQPILTARGCNSGPCHGKARGQNGFALSLLGFDADMDFHAIVKDGRGRRLFPSSPEQSLFLLKGAGQVPHGGGVRIDPGSDEYQAILDWVREGAPRTTSQDPVLTEIAITPSPHPMKPMSTEQLVVTATYSDRSTRVVTHTSAFQSNEPAVASVSSDGTVSAGSLPGEATIMARYMGRIATWNCMIPREDPIANETYAQLPRKNFVDDLVYEKLEQLRVFPSAPCSDEKFLRRIYLDVIGRLPSPAEVRVFLSSSDPEKRSKEIDLLLDRPEYADFWANKWADLLRPNPYRVGIKATLSLDGFLRQAFRENWPYDRFVRELLTAKGSTWTNGAVTIYRDRREPDEILSMVSQLFVGVRLDCAKCHQHPFEVYGQEDFYSLAAFFGRVGYKGTGLSPPISGGEEMVFVKSDGAVRHPLTQKVLSPKPLQGSPIDVRPSADPRVAFVDWLTQSDNPYFAQVAVNRIWAEVFGVGLVDPVDDIRATNPPSNPKLLAALAEHFRQVGFDQKRLLKTMLESNVYAMDSKPNSTNAADNRNFSRHYRRRMRAEVIVDAVCDVTGVDENYHGMPPGTRAVQLWTHRLESEFLDAFGRPDANQDPPCERMADSTVVQVLHLMNAPSIHQKITQDNSRCHHLADETIPLATAIEELYLSCFGRYPTEAEKIDLVAEFSKPDVQRRHLLEDILWSLLNSPEFVIHD